MNWGAVTAIASVISMVAFVATALFVAQQLRHLERSRYLQVSNDLYSTWGSRDFMETQLWLIHRLAETTWADFVAAHRGDYGEQAFHRVGSFYDRVGTLVRLGFIEEKEILSTIGPYAIAVWKKVQPLVHEARRTENSTLFDDFERMIPACYECYVPMLGDAGPVKPFTIPDTNTAFEAPRVTVISLHDRLTRGEPVTVLDVRKTIPPGIEAYGLHSAIRMDPDSVPKRLAEIPRDRDAVAYCS